MDRREALKNSALMLGVAASGSTLATLMQSCQTQSRIDWKPVFFSNEQATLVSEIAETILPKTDTPGAKDLKVDMFIDLIISETMSPDGKRQILDTIEDFQAICQTSFGKSFVELSTDERAQVLSKAEKVSVTFNPSFWGGGLAEQSPIGFYRRIKQLTLLGYYTSEHVGKNILSYDPIPGGFESCLPLKDVGNAWSL